MDDVGEAGDVGLANLDDGEGEDGEIGSDDAATDGLALALTGAAGAVAGVAVGEEEADTGRVHDTLLHRETLLVVAAGDADNVALPLVAQAVGGDLSAHLSIPRHSVSSQTEKCNRPWGLHPSPVRFDPAFGKRFEFHIRACP